MKKKRIIFLLLFFLLSVGLIICIIYLRNEWFVFLNNDKSIIGRDTVAYWCSSDGELIYEILRGPEDNYSFNAYISSDINSNTRSIEKVHFYANTSDYIFIVTDDLSYYVNKKTRGINIMTSSFFDLVSSEEDKVCFENLFSRDHIVKRY